MPIKSIILGLVSHRGCGKDLACQYVGRHYRAKEIIMSDYISQALKLFHLPPNRQNFPWLITKTRHRFGKGILARAVIKEIQDDGYQIYLLNGIRLKREVEILREKFGRRFVLVDLVCDDRIRFERIKKREKRLKVSKDNVNLTLIDFVKQEKRIVTEKEISAIERGADCVIENNGSKSQLFESLDELIIKLKIAKSKAKK